MEYTVKEIADLSGVTPRTIRYYDEIDLLNPKKSNSSGYRIYTTKEVDQLQQILFYKALGFNLESITKLIRSRNFDEIQVLKKHKNDILSKIKQLELLLENINETIVSKEKGIEMNDSRKFKGFKKNLVLENEKKYGEEIRNKYGNMTIDGSNENLIKATEENIMRLLHLKRKSKNY